MDQKAALQSRVKNIGGFLGNWAAARERKEKDIVFLFWLFEGLSFM